MKTISQIRNPKEPKTKVQMLIHEAGIGVRELGFGRISLISESRRIPLSGMHEHTHSAGHSTVQNQSD
jgi:hypothetical protein